MRFTSLHLPKQILPGLAAVALFAAVAAPEAVAEGLPQENIGSVTIQINSTSGSFVTELSATSLGAVLTLDGPDWSGLMTLPRKGHSTRIILLRSADGSGFVLGYLRPKDGSESDLSGYCIHVVRSPSHAFSFGSIQASMSPAGS